MPALTVPVVLAADTLLKAVRAHRSRDGATRAGGPDATALDDSAACAACAGRRRTRRHPLELKCRLRTKHDEMFLAYEAHPFYRR